MRMRTPVFGLLMILMVVACVGLSGCGHSRARRAEYNPYAYRAEPLDEQLQQLGWDDDWTGLLELWRQYSHMCDDETRCALLVAQANLELGRNDEAVRIYRTVIGTQEFWYSSERDRDFNIVVLGGVDETRCLRAAFDPDHGRAVHLLRAAEALLRIGAYREAIEACEAIEECGLANDPEMLMARGEAYYQLGDVGESARDFRRALESLDEEHARMRLRQMEEL